MEFGTVQQFDFRPQSPPASPTVPAWNECCTIISLRPAERRCLSPKTLRDNDFDQTAETSVMIEPTTFHGQELPVPESRVIGFVDTDEKLQTISKRLNEAGFSDSKIRVLHGPDGIQMLEGLREVPFFGDFERAVADFGIQELQNGHYSMNVAVKDRDEALHVTNIGESNGGHSFTYFGKWMNEQLTK
jgi:hypothetical protein